MTALWVRGRGGRRPLRWLSAVLFLAALVAPATAAEPIVVLLDQAKVVKVPERAAHGRDRRSADRRSFGAARRHRRHHRKGYGATNVIVMDTDRRRVDGEDDRGKGTTRPDRRGLSRRQPQYLQRTPECAPRITLGDDTDYFNKTLGDAGSRNTQAMSAAATSAAPAARGPQPTTSAVNSGR